MYLAYASLFKNSIYYRAPVAILATQEDYGLKPAQANSSTRPYLEKPFTKIGLVKWLKV
jgi:hypothetical protein